MRSFALRALSIGTALTLGATILAAQAPAQPRQGAGEQARGPRAERVGRAGGMIFRDITLTDAQRTRVREVQQRYAQERRQMAGTARTKQPRGARSDSAVRQRPDSAARVAMRAEREVVRTRMQQLSERQWADLRAVLEPSQRVTFDRNVSALKQRMSARGQERGDRGVRRGAKARAGGAAQRGDAAVKRGA
ncbi:MAG: Spy/CpxP family protein refolding chaperone [Gemmatirosa sp.]